MAKKAPAKRAPAKRKPRPKKPPVIETETGIELSEFSPETLKRMQEILDAKLNPPPSPPRPGQTLGSGEYGSDYGEPVDITSWIPVFLKYAAILLVGVGIGIWSAGGIPIGGDVVPVADAVSEVFDTQEAVFRKLNGELAQKLIAGEIKSENEARTWMESNFLPQSDAAWIKLLESEKAEFGGDKWTAEKQAAVIGRYAR
jgi:hypothetical protein